LPVRALRVGYLILFLGLALFYYEFHGAGVTPSQRVQHTAWWQSAGWARSLDWGLLASFQAIGADTVQARHEGRFEPRSLIPLGAFALPAAFVTAVGFLLFRGALMRAALLALGLTLCAFSYYGWLDLETWQDYGWRWPAVLLTTAGYLALFALAPALVAAARRRGWATRIAGLLAFAVPIYVLSIEVTGTNPTLQWNLSPWPTVTLYGFLLFGLLLGVIHLGAGVGLAVRARWTGAAGLAAGSLAAAALALALRRIPFEQTTALRLAALALPAALVVALAGRGRGEHAPAASAFLVAGLLLLGSIKAGQWHAERFLARARDEVAPQVIGAIERYHASREVYPGELTDLVPAELPAIPEPHIGWLDWDEEVFTYTDLGESFLLEFSGPLWVQCAYSPPYEEDADEEAEEEGVTGEHLGAAWSCERKPPRLW
jgi:hypothetical protein